MRCEKRLVNGIYNPRVPLSCLFCLVVDGIPDVAWSGLFWLMCWLGRDSLMSEK